MKLYIATTKLKSPCRPSVTLPRPTLTPPAFPNIINSLYCFHFLNLLQNIKFQSAQCWPSQQYALVGPVGCSRLTQSLINSDTWLSFKIMGQFSTNRRRITSWIIPQPRISPCKIIFYEIWVFFGRPHSSAFFCLVSYPGSTWLKRRRRWASALISLRFPDCSSSSLAWICLTRRPRQRKPSSWILMSSQVSRKRLRQTGVSLACKRFSSNIYYILHII